MSVHRQSASIIPRSVLHLETPLLAGRTYCISITCTKLNRAFPSVTSDKYLNRISKNSRSMGSGTPSGCAQRYRIVSSSASGWGQNLLSTEYQQPPCYPCVAHSRCLPLFFRSAVTVIYTHRCGSHGTISCTPLSCVHASSCASHPLVVPTLPWRT